MILLFNLVNNELQHVEDKMRDTACIEHPPLAQALAYLLDSGGKRLRPTLVLASTKFYPCDPMKALSLAAAVEMLHTATLIHDDLVDKSSLRRGQETLHAVWPAKATVLAGDYLLAE